jgi:hypothetical protein
MDHRTEIEKLIDHMIDTDHPGADLGKFIQQHSNSNEYLAGVLEAYLEAARADVAEEKRHRTSMLNAMKERERQERLARGEEMPAPDFTWIQLHLSVYGEANKKTLPKRYGKKIKALGGEYTECRGNQTTRFVNLPWTEEGRAIAKALVSEYGAGGKGTPVVIRGIDMSGIEEVYLQAWMEVFYVHREVEDPMADLLKKFEVAWSHALQRGVIHEKVFAEGVKVG